MSQTILIFAYRVDLGESEYKKFKDEILEKKTTKLFDPIAKMKKGYSTVTRYRPPDVKKETVMFMRNIDLARLRGYSISTLLQYEITSTSFFLTKDSYLRKSPKSELAQEVKKLITSIPVEVPSTHIPSAILFDFMAYCRKVPVKKLHLKTYEDLVKHLWSTFNHLSRNRGRLDIVFGLYLDQSIKQQERSRRAEAQIIETTISNIKQSLPIEIETFWGIIEQ